MTAPLDRRVAELVEAAARPLGVERFGFCSLDGLSGLLECRGKRLLPGEGGSAVVLLLPYYAGEFPGRNLARYAVCDDYHAVAGDILQEITATLSAAFPENRFVPFVDSSPIPEVEAGVLAGLGFRGRNGQLIAPGYGSLAFLCEVVTDLPLTPTGPGEFPGCGECTRCLGACPTGALGPEGLDQSKCRSHITQKKGELTPWEARQIRLGGMVWGCDLCTDACPWNRRPGVTPIPRLRERPEPVLRPDNLEALAPQKSCGWRGPGVLRRNLALLEGGGTRGST